MFQKGNGCEKILVWVERENCTRLVLAQTRETKVDSSLHQAMPGEETALKTIRSSGCRQVMNAARRTSGMARCDQAMEKLIWECWQLDGESLSKLQTRRKVIHNVGSFL